LPLNLTREVCKQHWVWLWRVVKNSRQIEAASSTNVCPLCCSACVQVAGMMGPAACLFAAASPLVHSPYVATGLITLGMGLSALTCSKCPAAACGVLDLVPCGIWDSKWCVSASRTASKSCHNCTRPSGHSCGHVSRASPGSVKQQCWTACVSPVAGTTC
jgi:hypothetical protein